MDGVMKPAGTVLVTDILNFGNPVTTDGFTVQNPESEVQHEDTVV